MYLSIIIPVYNVEQYITQCLQSIVSQIDDVADCEIIVVNDGTPDNSMRIVREYERRCKQIKIVEQENQGLSAARNAGMTVATGCYIWFVDSDDWLLDGALKKIYETIRNHENVDVFASALEYVYEKDGHHEAEYYPKPGLLTGKEYLKKHYSQGASPRFVFRVDFLKVNHLSFYPKILHEDGLFGYMMLYLAKQVYVLDAPIYAYLIRGKGSIMSSISIKSASDLLFIHKKLLDFMSRSVVSTDKKWFQECIFHVIECIFVFSESILQTDEFKLFYAENNGYIKKESFFLLRKPRTFIKGFLFLYKPQYWPKCRSFIVKIRNIFVN